MVKEIWFNLPVKNVAQSKDFFQKLGFPFNSAHATEHSAPMQVGQHKITVMLFEENLFKTFTQNELSDTLKGTEMLISIDAESREEVDDMARKAEEAGGTVYAKPAENQGWMYGCGFVDLDGHRWNVLYMDMSKMPR